MRLLSLWVSIINMLAISTVATADVVSVGNSKGDVVRPSAYVGCLNALPKTLKLPQDAPETMRLLVPKGETVIDYETLIAGQGWGASLKYHSAYCDVVVYMYNKNKSTLTVVDAQHEQTEFDGFKAERVFEKEVGDYIFYGKAAVTPLDEFDKNQVQMMSVGAVNNTFIKYRTVCRQITDIPAEANYRIADSVTSQVIKETLASLNDCISQEKSQ